MRSAKKALLLPETKGGERNGYHIYHHLDMLCSWHKSIAYPPGNREGILRPDRYMGNPDDRPWHIRPYRRIVR